MTGHGHILLRNLQVGAAVLREENGEQAIDESMSMQRFASSEVVPLDDAIAQKG